MPHSPSPSHREPTLSPALSGPSQFPISLSAGHSDEDAGRSVRVPHVRVPGVKVGVMWSQSGGEGGVFWHENRGERMRG